MKHLFLLLTLAFSVGVMAQEPLKDLPTGKANYEYVQETASSFEFSEVIPVTVFKYYKVCSNSCDFWCEHFKQAFLEADKAFENHYRSINLLNKLTLMDYGNSFGQAIDALKSGKMVKRQEHGENTFIFMQVPSTINKEVVPKMTSLPQSVKDEFERRFNDKQLQVSEIYYSDQLAIVNPSNLIRGYSPSPEDALADDWVILG